MASSALHATEEVRDYSAEDLRTKSAPDLWRTFLFAFLYHYRRCFVQFDHFLRQITDIKLF